MLVFHWGFLTTTTTLLHLVAGGSLLSNPSCLNSNLILRLIFRNRAYEIEIRNYSNIACRDRLACRDCFDLISSRIRCWIAVNYFLLFTNVNREFVFKFFGGDYAFVKIEWLNDPAGNQESISFNSSRK